jgi:hypothetical protein
LMEAMQPEFPDDPQINPFDMWEGANFKLKIRKVDGYWNYDKSEFDSKSQLKSTDDELEAIYKKTHSLNDFIAPSNFKTYDELKTRLDAVLSGTVATKTAAAMVDEEEVPFTPSFKNEAPAPMASVDAVEDDAMSYFEKLANE